MMTIREKLMTGSVDEIYNVLISIEKNCNLHFDIVSNSSKYRKEKFCRNICPYTSECAKNEDEVYCNSSSIREEVDKYALERFLDASIY